MELFKNISDTVGHKMGIVIKINELKEA